MPPKAPPSAAASERLKKELQAQRARAEALKHLQTTGAGPSQSELARQQAERQKLKNAASTRVERFVTGANPATSSKPQSAAERYDPRVRDNTLHAVAMRRANEIHQTQRTTQQLDAYRKNSSGAHAGGASGGLPDGWKEVTDPTSGDVYYWNERTNETSWDHPGGKQEAGEPPQAVSQKKDAADDKLPDGWEAVPDPQSGDVYYWNRNTNETSWTKPAPTTVSLEEAIAAKSKLDDILKGCGPSKGANKRKATDISSTNSASSIQRAQIKKKRDQAPGQADPLDPSANGA